MKKIRAWIHSPILPVLLIVVLLGAYMVRTIAAFQELNAHKHSSVFDDYQYHFAVDFGSLDSEMGREFLRGAQDCADEYGIVLEIKGDNSPFEGEEIDFYTWVSYVRPDGLITSNIMGREARQQLLDKGIACCAVYNDPGDNRFLYVGPDNYEQGYALAKQLERVYAGQTLNIALLYAEGEDNSSNGRLQGFLNACREGDTLKIFEQRGVEPGILRGMGVAEDIMLSHGEVNYFVCLDEMLLTSTVRGVVDLNRVRNISVSGIGTSEEIEGYIENQIVDLSVEVYAYQLGRLAVEKLYSYKQKNLEPDEMRTITQYKMVGCEI